jgi:hypothetical protein
LRFFCGQVDRSISTVGQFVTGLLADSTTLGFAISATTLATTAAGDDLKLFTNIDQSSQNDRNYTVHF